MRYFLPKAVKELLAEVDINAYERAKEEGDDSAYWSNHYRALKILEKRFYENRLDILPGVRNEDLYPLARALGEVFCSCLKPIVPVEANTQEEKETIKVAKGVAIYFIDSQNRLLQTGDRVIFDSMLPGGRIRKRVVVDTETPFGNDYITDVSVKLWEEDLKLLYEGARYEEWVGGEETRSFTVRVARNTTFFANYKLVKEPRRRVEGLQRVPEIRS